MNNSLRACAHHRAASFHSCDRQGIHVGADSSADPRFHEAAAPGISQNAAGHFSTDQFNVGSYQDNLNVASQDAVAVQPLADPMDLDFEFDPTLWAGAFTSTINHGSGMNIDYTAPMTAMPADFLFAEDEVALPAAPSYHGQPPHAGIIPQLQPPEPSPTRTVFHAPRSDVGSDDAKSLGDGTQNDLARQRLRRQLSLLSKGWAGDEIRFKNCDSSKAVVLHNLAMELGLGYSHDVRSREVSMSRLGPAQAPSNPQTSSSLPRSSTELDSTLCLPDLPTVPEIHEFDIPTQYSHEPNTQSASEVQPSAAAKDQPLVRRPSRSERISDSISKLKTSIAKGGRRGPLTENGRRDMRALEAAGGACWRCKVLRRKVSLP
jgi:hypothetical protein